MAEIALRNIKNIGDLRTYIEDPKFQFSNKNTLTKTLTGIMNETILDNNSQWGIWDRSLEKTIRYPFVSAEPKIMLFKKDSIDNKEYAAEVIFPLDFKKVIKKITFKDNNLMDIQVFENAYYWRYDIKNGKALKRIFRNYDTDVDFTIVRTSIDRKSTRLNSSHRNTSRMPSSA